MNEFVYGKYQYKYQLVKQKRKTFSLTVSPDLSISLKCPDNCTDLQIEKFLKKKWLWLEKQLEYFKKFQKKRYSKEYVSGDSFLYLGRQYKLKVKRSGQESVSLSKGVLVVFTSKEIANSKYNQTLLNAWYETKTKIIFQERFNEMLLKFNYKTEPKLGIREMKKRWGSFLKHKKVLLNPKLIYAAKECIDYVIVHELCHFTYQNHNEKFWLLLKKKYPNWTKVKDKLEMYNIE